MSVYRYNRRVSYYETDKMGIVHHTNHIRFFEEARVNFMYSIGCDVRELEKKGIFIPNVDAYAKYVKPIKFFDDICVEVKLVKISGAKMQYEYTITLCGTGKIAATGSTTHCFVHSDMTPVNIKKIDPQFFENLKNNISE